MNRGRFSNSCHTKNLDVALVSLILLLVMIFGCILFGVGSEPAEGNAPAAAVSVE